MQKIIDKVDNYDKKFENQIQALARVRTEDEEKYHADQHERVVSSLVRIDLIENELKSIK